MQRISRAEYVANIETSEETFFGTHNSIIIL
jgi:hypothetical protein